jgi:hypothetical protein
MKKLITLIVAFTSCSLAYSQSIGMGLAIPDPSAQLDISSNRQGILIPRMATAAITTISSPAKGLMVYDSSKNQLMVNMGTAQLPDWENIAANAGWSLGGNKGTDSAVNFIGSSDNEPIFFRVNNHWAGMLDSVSQNSFFGYGSGKNGLATSGNTAFGYKSMELNFTGNYNAAFGVQALFANPNGPGVGDDNTAIGYQAIYGSAQNVGNTAIGYQALYDCHSNLNTATGYQALYHSGTGASTATGTQALFNGGGSNNSAIGYQALYNNALASASYNTAAGFQALYNNNSGANNTVGGYQAMYKNSSGNDNTAYGASALYNNVYGGQNTTVGFNSLASTTGSFGNTAIGFNAGARFDNGYYNCFIGSETDANGPAYYNTIALGHGTIVTGPNMMRVGNTATISIGGPVGWSTISDIRVKKNIRENIPGLAFINLLQPISYTIDLAAIDRITAAPAEKPGAGSTIARQYQLRPTASYRLINDARIAKQAVRYSGFAAQDVEQSARSIGYAFSAVDTPKNDHDLYGLRYAEFVVPLVKAVQELSAQNDQIKKENETMARENQQVMQKLAILQQKIK